MKSVAFHNLGCKVNGYEMDYMQQIFVEKGYKIVPFDTVADIYIINTCTVTNIADRKSRQMLHKAKKRNPEAIVVAVGCYVQTGKEQALLDDSIDLAIGNNKKRNLVDILEEYLCRRDSDNDKTLNGTTIVDIGKEEQYESMTLINTAEHTRAFIKIQDGCNQFCSYCIIPYARGRIRSKKEDEVLKEVVELARNGYQEIVLTGIHLSSYGLNKATCTSDFSESRLLSLIKKLEKVEGIHRIRLGSLEPRIITREFVKGLSECEKVCPHFHLSLQSGCDSVLERMNRKYTTEEYYEKVRLLREFYDNPAITTDIIVGFPGETREEFEITKDFIQKVQFYEIHIFKYSKRHGTVAASMEGQITEKEKNIRSNELSKLEEQYTQAFRNSYLGVKAEVLVEEERLIGGRTYQIGHTRQYILAAVEAKEALSGKIVSGTMKAFLEPDILLFEM